MPSVTRAVHERGLLTEFCRQVQDVINDDPSVAWSPDGTQLLEYGGWGSYLVDVASGQSSLLSYLPGYGAVAWLDT